MLVEGGSRVIEGRQPGYTTTKLLDDILSTNYGDSALCRRLRARPGYHDRSWWWPHGACLFIARRSFLDLGGFDDRFYLYMEDVDLGRRLATVGGEVVGLPVRVRHGGSEGARISPGKRRRLLNAARVRYAGLYHGRHWAAFLGLIAAPRSAAHAILDWRK
jgi:GT2 family glycosyltransferase